MKMEINKSKMDIKSKEEELLINKLNDDKVNALNTQKINLLEKECEQWKERYNSQNKELSEYTLEDKSALSRALSLLISRDIVISNNDNYQPAYSLTKKGEEIAKYIGSRIDNVFKNMHQNISDDDIKTFYYMLNISVSNIERYYKRIENDKDI
jgi:DNA-binding MarR family transcriptional regulator